MSLIINLLSTGPGTFVYHLLIVLVLEAIVGIALIEWRFTHNPDHRRILRTFWSLLGMRVILLFGEPLGPAIVAPLLSGVELASLTLLGWAFLAPSLNPRAARGYLFAGLGATALCAVTFLPTWYKTLVRFPHLMYLTFWQQALWYIISTLLALAPALILLCLRRRDGHWLPVLGFGVLALGFATLLTSSLFSTLGWLDDISAYTLAGVGRLIIMIGYPLFAVTAHRLALQDKQTRGKEQQNTTETAPPQAQELQFLVELSRTVNESLDLDTILKHIAQNTAMALGADRCAVFLVNSGGPGTISLTAQHPSLQSQGQPTEQPAVHQVLTLAEQPALAHVLERRKPLTINVETSNPYLQALYRLFGGQETTGPTIVQPILHHRRIVGALVVGNDRSQRAFAPHESQLCQNIATQVAGAIENACLYRDMRRISGA